MAINLKNLCSVAAVAFSAMGASLSVFAADGPKLVKSMENANNLGAATGSAIYTWALVIGIVLIVAGIVGWVMMNKNQNQSQGATKMVIISIVAGAALSIISGVQMLGANLIDEEADQKIDYRALGTQGSNY